MKASPMKKQMYYYDMGLFETYLIVFDKQINKDGQFTVNDYLSQTLISRIVISNRIKRAVYE